MINYILSIFDNCFKWKRLYIEEHKKYKALKKWTEELIEYNSELFEYVKKH